MRLKFQPRLSNPILESRIPALRLKSQPWDQNPSLQAHIWASELKSQPSRSIFSTGAQILGSRLKFQPLSSNPCLKAAILTLRLKSQHWISSLVLRLKLHPKAFMPKPKQGNGYRPRATALVYSSWWPSTYLIDSTYCISDPSHQDCHSCTFCMNVASSNVTLTPFVPLHCSPF